MPRFHIKGPSGLYVSQEIPGDRVTVGRSVDNDIVLPNPTVSRRHAEIRREEDAWWVVDLGSRHGTSRKGRRVDGRERISCGDEIGIGPVILVMEEEGSGRPGGETLSTASHVSAVAARRPVLVGASEAMRRVGSMIDRIAASTETVLLTGETGTGKDLVAAVIHERSPRSSGPYVVVNCPALPGSLVEYELFGVEKRVATEVDARPGRLEMADGGTLLLDEVGDLDPSAQAKLLRFLDEKTVERIGGRSSIRLDVRILAATNRDLKAAVGEGSFRLDLYHRLNTVEIPIPPLRERREDIPSLVEHFLGKGAEGGPRKMSPEALQRLQAYDFPGNVRELERIVARVRLLADGPVILPDDLPDLDVPPPGGAGGTSPQRIAESLYERIVMEGRSFWEEVREPYLRRSLTAEAVRLLVERAFAQAGRSQREMARLFHLTDFREYKKLTDFLRRHQLSPRE